MYISRVEVDTMNRTKIKDLTHIGAFHSWVEDSFPDEKNQKIRTRKLWRVDKLNNKQYLIIVSQNKPDITLLEKYGVKNTASVKDYDSFFESVNAGDRMFFRIVLNPVFSKSAGEGKRGEIKPYYDIESQMKYLINRAEKNGFSLEPEEISIVEKGNAFLKKPSTANIKFVKAVYEGFLTIKDREKFIKILSEGMGKHKAYGFGLMTVVPLYK